MDENTGSPIEDPVEETAPTDLPVDPAPTDQPVAETVKPTSPTFSG